MTEKMEINNPIEIKENSKERVAFDLMKYIRSDNYSNYKTEKDVITLYRKCLEAIKGFAP